MGSFVRVFSYLEPRIGLEPMTCGLGNRCSVQLSYRGSCGVMRREEEGLGGDSGTRTRNLGIANAALSQLSYIPTQKCIIPFGASKRPNRPPAARDNGEWVNRA